MSGVFLSYRHEDEAHMGLVLGLARRLEREGITVVLDRLEQQRHFSGGGPDEGWPHWSQARAGDEALKVLIVASPGWFRAYEHREPPGSGLGTAAEAGVIAQRIYNAAGLARNIRVVSFAALNQADVPLNLQRYHRFSVPEDFAELVSWLSASMMPTTPPTTDNGAAEWPRGELALSWPIADQKPLREAFSRLLKREAPYRYLPVCGPAGVGKTLVTRQMLFNLLQRTSVACGRFDFRGYIDIENQFDAFVQQLGTPLPPPASTLSERLGFVLRTLVARARPAVLIFDTFEAAGEAERWVIDHLLMALVRAPFLRVVIAGQRVPERGGPDGDDQASRTIVLKTPTAADWCKYGRDNGVDVTPEFVQKVFHLCRGEAGVLAQILGRRP